MSKPASVAAPRAGVAGAPRVLLYVAEARQLEAAAGPDPPHDRPLDLYENVQQLPLYRHDHERNAPVTPVYYKPFQDSEENAREEYFPQSYAKENLRSEDGKNDRQVAKGDSDNAEWTNIDSYVRVPLQSELGYPARCPSDNMPLPVHNHSQFDSTVQSDEANDSVSVGKFVNYQLLEQSVSHQSIVNQGLNILNQQIGVRSIVSEGEAPQLVRTADGVVLAVLPSTVLPQETSDLRVQSEFPQTITVPLGWRRIVSGSSVLYVRYVFFSFCILHIKG